MTRYWKRRAPRRLPETIVEGDKPLDAEVTIRLPASLARRLELVALARDVTQGAVVRALLDEALPKTVARPAAVPVPYDHDAVVQAFEAATGWTDLGGKLSALGLEVVPRGGGLAILLLSTGEIACKASDVGSGYSDLIRRFGEGMPGHPHTWLAERVLAERPAAPAN